MTIIFDRSICCDLNETISREWLVTNGLGGYAAGTVAGVLTRMQHGMLVATPSDAHTPRLLLAKIDEEVVFDQRTYYLGTNEYRDGILNPSGFVHLETFRLEEGFPVFTYYLGGINGIILEKRIWMQQGLNTTFIQYRVLRSDRTIARKSGPLGASTTTTAAPNGGYGRSQEYAQAAPQSLTLTLLPFSACRPYNQPLEVAHQCFETHTYKTARSIEDNHFGMEVVLPRGVAGCTIVNQPDGPHTTQPQTGTSYHIMAVGHPDSNVTFIPTGVWYWNFLHRHDEVANPPSTDNLYLPGVIRATLWPGSDTTLTIIASAEDLSKQILQPQYLRHAYQQSVDQQKQILSSVVQPQRYFGDGGEAVSAHHLHILPLTTTSDPHEGGEAYLRTLLQAGQHMLVQRKPSRRSSSKIPNQQYDLFFGEPESALTILSDYYSMEARTRDALIAIPGLLLTTERFDEAATLLRELARHFKGGLLPDHLPLPGDSPPDSEYTSVDTTLWFFYALDYYQRVTRNYEFLEEFYYRLAEAIQRYIHGTSLGIQMDSRDGLLCAYHPGRALTWMNATIDGRPVTPRSGKPVEVNALWYYALALMHEWSSYLECRGQMHYTSHAAYYQELMLKCKRSFNERFWYSPGGYLYDVVDGLEGDDPALRPNQLLALSLRYPVLDACHQHKVFDVITQQLLTPYGLRTLSPMDSTYRGCLGESWRDHQAARHQGSVWTWLIGPYTEAMLAMRDDYPSEYGKAPDRDLCQEYLWRKGLLLLEPFRERFEHGLLGMCAGLCDGDAPHRTCLYQSSALSVAELLRIYNILAHMRTSHSKHVLA